MRPTRITDATVKQLVPPASGNAVTYDSDPDPKKTVNGFGVRITAAGNVAFVLRYRHNHVQRVLTIGSYPAWTVLRAREKAKELRRLVDAGKDPLAERVEGRDAPTIGDLAERFIEEHVSKKRPSTQRDYKGLIAKHILPELKTKKVAGVTFADVDGLHRKVTKTAPYRANRVMAVLSKMFALSAKWGWRTPLAGNPTKGVERNHEAKRERYLSGDELERLMKAIADHPDRQAADVFTLLALTGARSGEALSAKWDQFNLTDGTWTKQSSETKQKRLVHFPLSGPARQLLADLRARADKGALYVFPGPGSTGHRVKIKNDWADVCEAAGITGLRIHDLRHSFASFLVSSGESLPVIGRMLGHTQTSTTARYAHLQIDPLQRAADRIGALVSGGTPGKVVPLRKGG